MHIRRTSGCRTSFPRCCSSYPAGESHDTRCSQAASEREFMNWQENVRRVEPYVAGEQPKNPDVIKLNTNECPYPPAPGVAEAAKRLADEYEKMRLYPDMNASPLVQALAERYGVRPEQVFVGVGSDDVLAMAFLTFFTSGRRLLFPDITYSFYDVWAELYRIPYTQVPLQEDFTICPEDYIPGSGKWKGDETPGGGIIFPNPNAPTGRELPLADIERIAAANPDKVVIVDEAYVDFGAVSALPLLKKYENLLVVQTFSKSRAMAGARIGFAIGNETLIGCLKDVKFSFNSYTMNLQTIYMGTAAVEDEAYFNRLTSQIVETRAWFEKELTRLGFVYPESKANFIFARHPEHSGQELFDALRERNIFVRHWNKPRIGEYLRITIGTDEQMKTVVKALEEILA